MNKLKKWLKKRKVRSIEKKTLKAASDFKKSIASCGNNLQLFGKPEISFPERLKIGNDCKINSNVYINARSGVSLGNDVTLSYGVKIISTGYDIEHWIKTGEKIHIDNKPVCIGNHCWIGAGATILPGVKITGEFIVIAADAVVTKDITESNVIFAGSPAKKIKTF